MAVARFGLPVSLPSAGQQLDLQETERIDISIAHGDRPLKYWRLIEQPSFACDLERDAASAFIFFFEHAEDAPLHAPVERPGGVLAGNLKIGFGQCHLDIRDRAVKEWLFPIHHFDEMTARCAASNNHGAIRSGTGTIAHPPGFVRTR